MMKFWRSLVFCFFMVGFFTNSGYGQTSFGLNISYYLVLRNPISEALLQDTAISTYNINCLNQLDSIHLKAPQLFDSTRCEFLNYYLNIQRNDSVIEQVIWSYNYNEKTKTWVANNSDTTPYLIKVEDGLSAAAQKVLDNMKP